MGNQKVPKVLKQMNEIYQFRISKLIHFPFFPKTFKSNQRFDIRYIIVYQFIVCSSSSASLQKLVASSTAIVLNNLSMIYSKAVSLAEYLYVYTQRVYSFIFNSKIIQGVFITMTIYYIQNIMLYYKLVFFR